MNDEPLKVVDDFVHLGSLISQNVKACSTYTRLIISGIATPIHPQNQNLLTYITPWSNWFYYMSADE